MDIRADQVWTTPLNEMDVVQQGFDRSKTVRFYDTTLRDGEQSTGIVFSADDKVEIACKLADLGVGRIESGFPRVSEEDTEAVKRILAANLNSEIWGFARCVRRRTSTLMSSWVRAIPCCEITTSDMKMKAFGFTREKVMNSVIEFHQTRKRQRHRARQFLRRGQHAERFGFPARCLRQALAAGADEVSVVDTIGVCAPETAEYLDASGPVMGGTNPCRYTGTATMIWAWPRPRPSPQSAAAPTGSRAPSTAWASAPATPTFAKSLSPCSSSTTFRWNWI